MSLTLVKISEEVWLTCTTHALSTETEEIMGLLLGDIQSSESGGVTALIWGACPQQRSDRKKDRVETNPEQLAAASAQADVMNLKYLTALHKMTKAIGRTTRVIGWYHSHPHITVLPSHVDVRTQAMYQLLDSGFVGLIFSCFSEDVRKVGRVQVIAFQSLDGKQSQMLRAVPLSPVNKGAIIDLDLSVSTSESASARSGTAIYDGLEQDTADSRAIVVSSKASGKSSDLGGFFASADSNYIGKEKTGVNYPIVPVDNATAEIDSMDTSDSMQEALLRSNLEVSGAEFVRKEIPLNVLPTSSLLELDSPLTSFLDLQHVLFEEEQAAYNQAILQSMRDGKVHPLTFIHQTSTYQASLCKLMEYCLSPAVNALQDRLRVNERVMATLADEAKLLESEALKNNDLITNSPRNSPHGVRSSPVFGHKDLYNPIGASSTRSGSSRSRRGS